MPTPAVLSSEGLTGSRTVRGNVTLTDDGAGGTRVDILVRGSAKGYTPVAIPDLVWVRHFSQNLVPASGTLHGGATVVGTIPSTPSQGFGAGQWAYSMDETTFAGSIAPDVADSFLYSDGTPLPPAGTDADGPFWGGVGTGASTQRGYYQTPGPDAYVNVSFTVPPVSFAPGTGAVTITPNP